jgi:hypothetical protein
MVPESELLNIRKHGLKVVEGQRKFVFDCKQDCFRAIEPDDWHTDLALLKLRIPSNIKVYTDLPGYKYITRTIPSDCVTIVNTDSSRKSKGENPYAAFAGAV